MFPGANHLRRVSSGGDGLINREAASRIETLVDRDGLVGLTRWT